MGDEADQHGEVEAEPHAAARAPRPEYGSYVREGRAIREASRKLIDALAREELGRIVPQENNRYFRHGTGWTSPASTARAPDEAKLIRHEYSIHFADVVAHDLTIIPKSIRGIADGVASAQIGQIFEAVSESCDRTGNHVDGSERPFADTFMEMIEKIEFGVDANGEIEMPSIFAAPDQVDKMVASLESQPPEYQARAEALMAEKKKQALAREQERLARFKRPAP